MNIDLPKYSKELFKPYRYKVFSGGRGSGKSWTVARVLILLSRQHKFRILCAREFQSSISESVHKLLESQIYLMGLQNFFSITKIKITGKNGSEFFFKGLYSNVQAIKSTESIDILWLEEAQTVSKTSWDILIPTIRKEKSEIWCTYNPENEDDPTHTKFVNKSGENRKLKNAYIKTVNYSQNPWFPKVLDEERIYMKETDIDLYNHVWGGECRQNSHAQIFRGKYISESFEIEDHFHGPYLGADWGFSKDSTVLIECYIDPEKQELLVRREAEGVGIDINKIPALFKKSIPNFKDTLIKGDCSRPETISYLSNKGIPIEAAKKWSGSVEDGIDFLKSFRIIKVHTDCPFILNEFKKYSFKIDKLTDRVLRDIIDANNHGIDALRYSLDGMITANASILDVL